MYKIIILTANLTVLMITSGCATIVSDNDTNVYLQTEPEQARCELEGKDLTRSVNTPASLSLPAKAAPITITCIADGYNSTTDKIDTAMDGWILGNILFGGLIGVVIDAASGSGQKYPSEFFIALQPTKFGSIVERDQWFTRRREQIEKKWKTDIDQAKVSCNQANIGGSDSTNCDAAINKAEELKDAELMELEMQKNNAVIASSDT